MKKITTILLSLTLSLSLLCPAWAAGGISPILKIEDGSGKLTLEGLGDQSVYSIQLELTMTGNGEVSFSPAASAEGNYGVWRKSDGNKVTIYLDSLQRLDRDGTASLGTLRLSGGDHVSGAALTLLGRDLDPNAIIAASSPIQVQNVTDGGSSSGGGESSSSRAIRVTAAQHGKITVRPAKAGKGDTVTVNAKPDSGYQLSQLSATSKGQEIALTNKGDGTFTFTMPAAEVEIQGVFSVSDPAPVDMPFTDVEKGIWYYDAVQYAYGKGLVAGVSETSFGPDLTTSRGMIVTILHRLAGTPAAGDAPFDDVDDGKYYARAVAWAASNGIVSGYGDGRFGPDDPVTREQMAVILRGYARLLGRDVNSQADLSGYRDEAAISAYALEAMRWANAEGLINGTPDSELLPVNTATRAQVVVILRSFCENVISDQGSAN